MCEGAAWGGPRDRPDSVAASREEGDLDGRCRRIHSRTPTPANTITTAATTDPAMATVASEVPVFVPVSPPLAHPGLLDRDEEGVMGAGEGEEEEEEGVGRVPPEPEPDPDPDPDPDPEPVPEPEGALGEGVVVAAAKDRVRDGVGVVVGVLDSAGLGDRVRTREGRVAGSNAEPS